MAFGGDDLSDSGGSVNRSDSSNVQPRSCLADCGFFGSPQFQGYCSQCYVLCEIAKYSNNTTSNISANHHSSAKVAKSNQSEDVSGLPRPPLFNEEDKYKTNNDDCTSTVNDELSLAVNSMDETQSCSMESKSNANRAETNSIDCLNDKMQTNYATMENMLESDHVTTEKVEMEMLNLNNAKQNTICEQVIDSMHINNDKNVEDCFEPVQKDTTRCAKCNTKLRLTDPECVCGLRFCRRHRFSQAHECSFDYKSEQQKKLEKEIPKVAPRNIKDF